ncbi:hypothetical protein EJB05_36463, partial [Eragrostis curvula]
MTLPACCRDGHTRTIHLHFKNGDCCHRRLLSSGRSMQPWRRGGSTRLRSGPDRRVDANVGGCGRRKAPNSAGQSPRPLRPATSAASSSPTQTFLSDQSNGAHYDSYQLNSSQQVNQGKGGILTPLSIDKQSTYRAGQVKIKIKEKSIITGEQQRTVTENVMLTPFLPIMNHVVDVVSNSSSTTKTSETGN